MGPESPQHVVVQQAVIAGEAAHHETHAPKRHVKSDSMAHKLLGHELHKQPHERHEAELMRAARLTMHVGAGGTAPVVVPVANTVIEEMKRAEKKKLTERPKVDLRRVYMSSTHAHDHLDHQLGPSVNPAMAEHAPASHIASEQMAHQIVGHELACGNALARHNSEVKKAEKVSHAEDALHSWGLHSGHGQGPQHFFIGIERDEVSALPNVSRAAWSCRRSSFAMLRRQMQRHDRK